MAAHQIGKFKFKISKNGFQYKWGDGEPKTLFKPARHDEDDYMRYQGDDSDYAYEEDNGYYDQPEPEEVYDDQYYDETGDMGGEGDVYYDEEEEPQAGPVMEYIENNQWVLFVLLVILPPVGIYLLWRFNRYDIKVRSAISAVAAVWFIVALILILSGIFSGGEETRTDPQMTLTSMKPVTQEPTTEPTSEPTATAEPVTSATAAPSPTPLAGGNTGSTGSTGGTASSGNVYSPQTGLYYHYSENCTKIDANVSVTLVTLEAAKNRNQSACPLCGGGTVYYATSGGSRYHTDKNCDGMTNAVEYSKEAAEAESKVACWICAGGTEPSSSTDSTSKVKKYAASITNDKSGLKVWMTSGGSAYHATSDCRGMSGASQVTLLKAIQSGKPACSECLSYLNSYVYCTSGGTYYHSASTTCGMKNGTKVTLSAALVLGKKKCPDCIDESLYENKKEEAQSSANVTGEIMVYATSNGSWYHTDQTCGGMKNASRVTLKAALKAGRPACPVCCPAAEKTVYAAENSKYYHSYAGCSSLKNPVSGTLAQALTYNLTACPKCWNSNGEAVKNEDTSAANKGDDANNSSAYSGIFVYATETGSRYHANKSCSAADDGMVKVLLEQAIDDGKKPCSTCASYADDTVYGVSGNKYFHKTSNCSGITGAKKGTVVEALLIGLKACPICFTEEDIVTEESTTPTTNKFKSGKSGIDVYATYEGRYYHINRLCSGISGTPVEVSLETALNNDKSACPICSSSADRTVYGTTDGKYYHYSSGCAGDSATKANLDVALAYGFKACPNCVTKSDATEKLPSEYKEGTSGIKVYALATDDEYHTRSDCGGMANAQYVPLEKVLNLGYSACDECASIAGRKVYAYEGSTLYHYTSECQGKGYISGKLDSALAYGFEPCPICVTGTSNEDGETDTDLGEIIGGSEGNDDVTVDTKAPANTNVYVDLSGDTSEFVYHADDKCVNVGMTGGIGVTLEYALDHGYSPCNHCNPAASIE